MRHGPEKRQGAVKPEPPHDAQEQRRDELCTDVLWEVRDAFLVSLAVAP
ncbi:hypothetical protein PC119_g1680 [Phytophthora cactorum]|nr:hypothetical protein PC119_g1680 [Phytophthora cactorum]